MARKYGASIAAVSEIFNLPANPPLTLALVAMTFVVSIASVPVVVIVPPVIPEPLLVAIEVTVPPASISVSVTENCPCALILNCFVPGEVGRLPTRRPPSILTPPPTFKVLSGFNVLIPTLLAEVIRKALSLLVCASFKIDI